MDKVTQSNAAAAEESASASEELNAQAQTLRDAVGELLALVGSRISTRAEASGGVPKKAASPSIFPVEVEASSLRRNGRRPKTAQITDARTRAAIPLDSDFQPFR